MCHSGDADTLTVSYLSTTPQYHARQPLQASVLTCDSAAWRSAVYQGRSASLRLPLHTHFTSVPVHKNSQRCAEFVSCCLPWLINHWISRIKFSFIFLQTKFLKAAMCRGNTRASNVGGGGVTDGEQAGKINQVGIFISSCSSNRWVSNICLLWEVRGLTNSTVTARLWMNWFTKLSLLNPQHLEMLLQ